MSKSNPFKEAIKGVRTKVTKAIDVSDLLLGDLLDRDVITETQCDEIKVRCFAVSVHCLLLENYTTQELRSDCGEMFYCVCLVDWWSTFFLCNVGLSHQSTSSDINLITARMLYRAWYCRGKSLSVRLSVCP